MDEGQFVHIQACLGPQPSDLLDHLLYHTASLKLYSQDPVSVFAVPLLPSIIVLLFTWSLPKVYNVSVLSLRQGLCRYGLPLKSQSLEWYLAARTSPVFAEEITK